MPGHQIKRIRKKSISPWSYDTIVHTFTFVRDIWKNMFFWATSVHWNDFWLRFIMVRHCFFVYREAIMKNRVSFLRWCPCMLTGLFSLHVPFTQQDTFNKYSLKFKCNERFSTKSKLHRFLKNRGSVVCSRNDGLTFWNKDGVIWLCKIVVLTHKVR